MERDDPEALRRVANAAISRAQFAAMKANGSAASCVVNGSAAPDAAFGSSAVASCDPRLSEAEGATCIHLAAVLSGHMPFAMHLLALVLVERHWRVRVEWCAGNCTPPINNRLPAYADVPVAIDFSITEDSLEQPPPAEKVPPGAPGLAKITLIVTEEDGQRVRRTLHDLTARLLGVETPPLPSIRQRKKLALECAQVWQRC